MRICLYAENIEKDYIWSYFRLELDELKPIFEIDDGQIYENLTEDVSGHYISWKCGNYGYYEDGTPLPKDYRIVYRYLKGSFVIFAKTSIEECDYPHLYPVRFEEYCAYNNYVGKYADLTDLNDEYTMCLQGWLLYLKSGRTTYMDYVHKNDDIEKLLEEIEKFY